MTTLQLKESYCFDDVLMLPLTSDIESRKHINLETNLGSNGRNLILKRPLISSPMDTVTGENMAIKMALEGAFGVIHRFMPFEQQLQAVKNVKRYINYVFTNPYKITTLESYQDVYDKYGIKTFIVEDDNKKFRGLVTNRDFQNSTDNNLKYTSYYSLYKLYYTKYDFDEIISNRNSEKFKNFMLKCKEIMTKHNVEKCPIFECIEHLDMYLPYGENRDKTENLLGLVTMKSVEHYFNNRKQACLDNQGRLCVGAAVGIRDNYLEKVSQLVEVGVDCICVDVANGHNKYTIDAVKQIRTWFPNLVIMAGNIITPEGLQCLTDAGADCIRIGIGNGSICSTRLETGVGLGQFTAIRDVYQYKKSKNLDVKLICDGGSLGKTGNKVKALVVGADALILGRTLAGTEESPGTIITRNGKRMKYFRGMASTMANISNQESKAKRAKIETNFTAEGVDGVVDVKGSVTGILDQICGGIRSGFSYLNCKSFEQLNNIRDEVVWVKSTPIGLTETSTRIKTF